MCLSEILDGEEKEKILSSLKANNFVCYKVGFTENGKFKTGDCFIILPIDEWIEDDQDINLSTLPFPNSIIPEGSYKCGFHCFLSHSGAFAWKSVYNDPKEKVIKVEIDEEEITAIGQQDGWDMVVCRRIRILPLS